MGRGHWNRYFGRSTVWSLNFLIVWKDFDEEVQLKRLWTWITSLNPSFAGTSINNSIDRKNLIRVDGALGSNDTPSRYKSLWSNITLVLQDITVSDCRGFRLTSDFKDIVGANHHGLSWIVDNHSSFFDEITFSDHDRSVLCMNNSRWMDYGLGSNTNFSNDLSMFRTNYRSSSDPDRRFHLLVYSIYSTSQRNRRKVFPQLLLFPCFPCFLCNIRWSHSSRGKTSKRKVLLNERCPLTLSVPQGYMTLNFNFNDFKIIKSEVKCYAWVIFCIWVVKRIL